MFLDYVQLLIISRTIWAKNIDRNTKKRKRPPKSSENKMFVFGLCSTSDDWPSDLNKKCWPKCKKNEKGPLSHWKIKCSILDYVQLLMISWVIEAKNVNRNAKKWKRPPKAMKNQMFIFGLRSTSDDRLSDLSKNIERNAENWKRPPKSSKNIMFIFGLCSTSDDWLSNPRKKRMTKMQKNERGPLSHWKIKCLFFNYINFWWLAKRSE